MRLLAIAGVFVASLVVACSVQNNPSGSSSGGSPSDPSGGTSTNPTNNPDGGSSQVDGSKGDEDGGGIDFPPPPPAAAVIDIDGTCAAFSACGGNPQGTYDYTSGCIEDVFAGARDACPALDTSKASVTVKGAVSFYGNALSRNITVTTSGSITFPASCSMGQCALIENELKSAFTSVSCTGATDCTCTVSRTDVDTDKTTYTVQGNVLTTADGDEYSICVNGADFAYSGKSAAAEDGSFTLKKR